MTSVIQDTSTISRCPCNKLTPNIFPNKVTIVGRQVIVVEVRHIFYINHAELIFSRNTIYESYAKTSKGKIV